MFPMGSCIIKIMMIRTFSYKSNPIKFNVFSFGPLKILKDLTVSEDVFTVVLAKMWVCYLCHFPIIMPNIGNV